MDLERIKQNFRLRSGRKSKPKKVPRSEAPKPQETPVHNGVTATPAKEVHASPPHTVKKEEEKPEAEPDKPFDDGPDTRTDSQQESNHSLPPATGSEDGNSGNTTPRQYGHSGITIPHQSQTTRETASSQRTMAAPQSQNDDMSDPNDFDLKAPAAKPKPPSVESLSELLFSAGHLNSILHDPREIARFTAFINKFKPDYQPLILRFLETQKAIKAIEYANAVAEGAALDADEDDKASEKAVPSVAATLDKDFEEASNVSFEALVGTALPAYVTFCLTKLVTECLTNEITGKQSSLMQNLVGGLSEVFCLTDPTQEDNPIIYASEEFYRYTGYGSDDVIGSNCRFLQGRKTNPASPRRLHEHITKGDGICETLLNYKRDGRPFINLLLVAPLHDDQGKVKYFIGAQTDVTGLVENGRGLDAFERFLAYRQFEDANKSTVDANTQRKKKALKKLRELSESFDLEESAVVQTGSRASSMSRDTDARSASSSGRRSGRRVLGEDDEDSEEDGEPADRVDKDEWKLGSVGPTGLSGKLPGIYETYMLIRPAPSLRIIFVSPKLRKVGKVVQSPFLSHVAAPATTLEGLKESFTTGTPVLAKINFLAQAGASRDGTKTDPGYRHEDGKHGRACWISATPLVGSDDRVGVWMIVVVEKSKARRTARVAEVEAKAISKAQANKPNRIEMPKRQYPNRGRPEAPQPAKEEMPIKPKRLDESKEDINGDTDHPPHKTNGVEDEKASSTARQTNKTETSTDPTTPQHVNQADEHHRSTTPLNAEKHADQDNGVSDDDQLVSSRPPTRQESSRDRVRVQSDGVGEPDPEEQNDWQPTRSRSNTPDPSPDDRKYTPPPEIPESMVGATPPLQTPSESQRKLEDLNVKTDNDEEAEHEHDATPTRTRSDHEDHVHISNHDVSSDSPISEEDDDAQHTPTHEHGPDGTRQSSLLAMDYLRHPGSRLTPTKKKKHGTEADNWLDPECDLMSPYSVD